MKTFFCPTMVDCGKDVLETLPSIIDSYGDKVFVVMDPFFVDGPLQRKIEKLLDGMEIAFFSHVTPNPRDHDINEGAALCAEMKANVILGIGGGSAIDSAKAVNVVATNGGEAWEFINRKEGMKRKIEKQLLPLIAIPTTSGTGSEATRYSVITNHETHAKATIKSDLIFPTRALCDPMLTMSVPRKTTALTGIDAFAHCFEAYVGTKANDFSELFSLKGMKLFAENIEKVCNDGNDVQARENMALCSTLGGLSITHSATNLPHGIGQALSGVTDAPHGGSIAICMPQVVRWTLPQGLQKYAETACILNPELNDLSVEEQAYALPDILEDLFQRIIGEKLTMASFGLTEDKIDDVVQMAFTSYSGDLSRSPRVPNEEELRELIYSCL